MVGLCVWNGGDDLRHLRRSESCALRHQGGLAGLPWLNYDSGMEATETISSSDALFPTLLADPEPVTRGEALIQQAQMLLRMASELPTTKHTADAKDATLAEIRQIIQHLHVRFAGPETVSLRSRIRQARKDANLSVYRLAKLANVSPRHINRVEDDEESFFVSQEILMKLCAVPELRLIPPDLTKLPRLDGGGDLANFIVTDGFDPLGMHREMKQILASSGGALEQSHVYLDYESAQDWLDLCNSPGYVAMARSAFPHREAAKRLAQLVGRAGMDLVMLGPGDGKTEVLFTQQVLGETEDSALRMYLLDASQALLNRAYAHALETLGRNPRVTLWPMQGTFFQLARYKVLNAAPHQMHRRRVYTIFGNTIANLDNEASFLRSSFTGAVKGDVLLFDADHAFTKDVHDADKIRAADPVFRAPISPGFRNWLGGPLFRHCKTATKIDLFLRVDADRLIAGSYGFQTVGQVQEPDDRVREFVLWNVRRYDLDKLSELVQRLGWAEVGRFVFSSTERPRSLLMFQKL